MVTLYPNTLQWLYTNSHLLSHRCAQCFRPFPDGVFYEFEGRKYCEHDFHVLFAPCCAKCGKMEIHKLQLSESYLDRHMRLTRLEGGHIVEDVLTYLQVQGDSCSLRTGLRRLWFWMFHCLPNFALAGGNLSEVTDRNLAEVARQHGGTSKSKSSHPRYQSRWITLYRACESEKFSAVSQESIVSQVFDGADKSPSNLQEHGVILRIVFGRNLLGSVLFKFI